MDHQLEEIEQDLQVVYNLLQDQERKIQIHQYVQANPVVSERVMVTNNMCVVHMHQSLYELLDVYAKLVDQVYLCETH